MIFQGLGKILLKKNWPSLAVLSICLSCGSGTEIGNGLKPWDGDKKDKGNSDETPQSNGNSSQPTPVSDEENTETGNSSTTPQQTQTKLGFSLSLLTTTCAPIWEMDLKSPISLARNTKPTEVILKLEFDDPKDTWTMSDSDNETLRLVHWLDANTVETLDADEKAISDSYTCLSAPTNALQADDPSVTVYTASLVPVNAPTASAAVSTTLHWYVRTTNGERELVKIEVILPSSNGSIILDIL